MLKKIILVNLILVLVLACKKDEVKIESHTSEITFLHSVDGNLSHFNEFIYTNEYGNNYNLLTLRYFISEVELKALDNDIIKFDDIIYVDASNPDFLKATFNKKIPNKTYSQIKFTFGISTTQNVTGLFNNFPQTSMEWPVPMGGGYHYMKLEGKLANLSDTINYNVHTGPLNGNPNYFEVVLPLDLQVEDNKFAINLNMEINNWFNNPNTINLEDIVGGMMGNQDMQQKLKENGVDVFSIVP